MSDRKDIRDMRRAFLAGIGNPEEKPFVPDSFQLDAIRSLKDECDTLVVAPTGAGKTYIATEAIAETVKQGHRAVYTAPLKALSNSKYVEFKKRFEPEHPVGLLTGDRKIEGDSAIVIATTEIYRNELYSMRGDYRLVVLDEFHYLSDSQRGPVWEESVILSPREATLLMLSASVSNAEELAEWIHSIRGKEVRIVSIEKRPVELRLGFLHPELGVLPLADSRGNVLREVSKFYSDGGGRNSGFRKGFRGRGGGKGRGRGRGR